MVASFEQQEDAKFQEDVARVNEWWKVRCSRVVKSYSMIQS